MLLHVGNHGEVYLCFFFLFGEWADKPDEIELFEEWCEWHEKGCLSDPAGWALTWIMSSFANKLGNKYHWSRKFLRMQEIMFEICCVLKIQWLFHMDHWELTYQIYWFICLLEDLLEIWIIIVQNVALLQLLLLRLQIYTQFLEKYNSIQEHIEADNKQDKEISGCGNIKSITYKYNSPPHFWMIWFTENSQDIDISKTITLNSEAGPVILPICGVLYYTGNKFVSRMISPTGEVWYHWNKMPMHTWRSFNCLKCHGSKRRVGVVYSV